MFEKFFRPPTTPVEGEPSRRLRLGGLLEAAQAHAIDLDSERSLISRYIALYEAEQLPVPPEWFNAEELQQAESRIMQATAEVETISDFQMLLSLVPGLRKEYQYEWLAHENAHANVAEQKSDTTVLRGYGLVFFARDGRMVEAKPVTWTYRREGADRRAYLVDKIDLLEAPGTYGEQMSRDDREEAALIRRTLGQTDGS